MNKEKLKQIKQELDNKMKEKQKNIEGLYIKFIDEGMITTIKILEALLEDNEKSV